MQSCCRRRRRYHCLTGNDNIPLIKVNAAYNCSIANDAERHDDEEGTAHHATTTATTASEFDLTMT